MVYKANLREISYVRERRAEELQYIEKIVSQIGGKRQKELKDKELKNSSDWVTLGHSGSAKTPMELEILACLEEATLPDKEIIKKVNEAMVEINEKLAMIEAQQEADRKSQKIREEKAVSIKGRLHQTFWSDDYETGMDIFSRRDNEIY